MKGFTLIEMIIYIAASSLIITAIVSLAFTLIDADFALKNIIDTENAGLTAMRIIDEKLRDHISFSTSTIASDFGLTDFVIESATSGTRTIFFKISDQPFLEILYVEP